MAVAEMSPERKNERVIRECLYYLHGEGIAEQEQLPDDREELERQNGVLRLLYRHILTSNLSHDRLKNIMKLCQDKRWEIERAITRDRVERFFYNVLALLTRNEFEGESSFTNREQTEARRLTLLIHMIRTALENHSFGAQVPLH